MNSKEKPMSLALPKPVTTYLAAVEAKDTGCYPCALRTEANAKPRRLMNEKA
jgi:hypothetical protein